MRVARRRNPFEDHVYQAVTRYRQEGTRGIAWTYDHMSRADRAAFDEHLVAVKHPLAYQPGTNEERFRAYVIEVSKYPRRDNGLAGSLWRGARAGYHDYRAGALQARADAHRRQAVLNPRVTIKKIVKAGAITFRDSGQTIAYVEWIDTAGRRGRTEGNESNAHMQALIARARRERVRFQRRAF